MFFICSSATARKWIITLFINVGISEQWQIQYFLILYWQFLLRIRANLNNFPLCCKLLRLYVTLNRHLIVPLTFDIIDTFPDIYFLPPCFLFLSCCLSLSCFLSLSCCRSLCLSLSVTLFLFLSQQLTEYPWIWEMVQQESSFGSPLHGGQICSKRKWLVCSLHVHFIQSFKKL